MWTTVGLAGTRDVGRLLAAHQQVSSTPCVMRAEKSTYSLVSSRLAISDRRGGFSDSSAREVERDLSILRNHGC